MPHKPVVSVLLPVKDAAPFLPACLRSLLGQTLADIEIVAVENGSTDESPGILRAAAARDARLRLLRVGPVGLVRALNAGLEACRADWIARMDADDLCRRDRLERQAAALRDRPRVDVLACRVVPFPGRNVAEGFRLYMEWQNGLLTPEAIENNFFVESPLPHPAVMFRAERVREAGGYREGPWPEDYELWLRMRERGAGFAKLPQTLLAWRMHAGRLSLRDPRYAREAFLRLKAQALAKRLPEPRVVLAGAGQYARRLAPHLSRCGIEILAAFDIDPRKFKRRLAGKEILPYFRIPDWRPTFILAAVGARGKRAEVRSRLDALSLREGRDYLCVA